MLQPNKKKIFQEISKCASDFAYFAEQHIRIVDINGKETNLKINEAQRRIFRSVNKNPHLMVLKARKLGSTTVIAAYFLWKALFNKNNRIAVVAHTDDAARAIFQIYQFMYANLPTELSRKEPAQRAKAEDGKPDQGRQRCIRGVSWADLSVYSCFRIRILAKPRKKYCCLIWYGGCKRDDYSRVYC